MLPSLENSCRGHCTCQVGASGKGMPPRALAPPLLWGLESPGRRGNGTELAVPCWLHLPSAPQVTQVCPPSCAHGSPRSRRAVPAPPKGRNASLHPNDYLSLGALLSSLALLPGPGHTGGTAAPLLTNRLCEVLLASITTGKPNTLDILVICCEIVS